MGAPCQGGFISRSEFGCGRLFLRCRQQHQRPVNLTATPVNLTATPDNSDNAAVNDDNDDRSG
jgi:hypothetical protein